MTVSSTTNRAQFNCNGSTTSFPFTFKYLADSDLQVYLSSPAGVVTLLTLNVDYEITPAVPGPGGTLSFLGTYLSSPPVSGYTLTILRFIARTQEVDFINGDSLDENNIEGMGDKLTMMVQDLDERIGRAVTVPPSSGISNISVPDPVAGAFLRWNLSGNGLENATYVDPTLITISDFIKTLLDDNDAAAARATLQIPAASESVAGLAELATQAEVDAGTDDARIVTPKKLYATPGMYRKNALINGDFRINQRGYASAAVLASGTYGHDRWKAGASGGDYSFTQLAGPTTITIASGKTLIQVVEDSNVVGGTYVLSWTGTAQARYGLNSATPSGEYAASPVVITGQNAGTVMSVEFSAGTLGLVQLELGSAATPFEFRPFGEELALCQRYYENSPIREHLCGAYKAAYISTAAIYFGVRKRVAPTIALANLSFLGNMGSDQALYNAGQAENGFSPIFSTTGATGGDAGKVQFSWTANAEL